MSQGSLTNSILQLFYKAGDRDLSHKSITHDLRITSKDGKRKVLDTLLAMVDKGTLKELHRGKFTLAEATEPMTGVADFTSSGAAYVTVVGEEHDIYIPAKYTLNAFHQDTVRIEIIPGRGNKPEGKIVEVVERKRTEFIGSVQLVKDFAFVIPDNPKIHMDFYVPAGKIMGAKEGQKVIVRLGDWPKNSKNPFGEIIEVLGDAGNNDVEMHAILFQYGLP